MVFAAAQQKKKKKKKKKKSRYGIGLTPGLEVNPHGSVGAGAGNG